MASNFDSPSLGSDELPDTFICDPCNHEGLTETAVGFCVDCNHYLCKHCYDCHTKPMPCRHHALLDEKNMPKLSGVAKLYLNCSKHDNKPVEYLCEQHDIVGCVVCVTLEHKQCKLSYIEEKINTAESVKECDAVVEALQSAEESIAASGSKASKNITEIEEFYDATFDDVKKVKKDVLKTFHVLEKRKLAEAKSSKVQSIVKMEAVKNECAQSKRDIGKLAAHLQLLKLSNQKRHLYLATRHVKQQLQDIQRQACCIKNDTYIQRKEFVRVSELNVMLNSVRRIGEIHAVVEDWGLVGTDALLVKSPEDIDRCDVTGICHMTDGKIVVSDRRNMCIKVVDSSTGSMVTRYTLKERPQAIANVDTKEVAALLHSCSSTDDFKSSIRFFVLHEKQLDEAGGFPLNDNCCDIAYCDGSLIVTYRYPLRMERMTLDGKVLVYVPVRVMTELLCPSLMLATSSTENTIYIADEASGALYSYTHNGRLINKGPTYMEEDIQLIATEGKKGVMFICNRMRRTISILTSDMRKVKETGKLWDTNRTLRRVSFSDRTQTLYLSVCGLNHLMRFELKK